MSRAAAEACRRAVVLSAVRRRTPPPLLLAPTPRFPAPRSAAAAMCKFIRTSYRCGHTVQETSFCEDAPRDPNTNHLVMCKRRLQPTCYDYAVICGEAGCTLSSKGGVWVCCKCHFGETYHGLNRHRFCIGRDCDHEVCAKCEPWKPSL